MFVIVSDDSDTGCKSVVGNLLLVLFSCFFISSLFSSFFISSSFLLSLLSLILLSSLSSIFLSLIAAYGDISFVSLSSDVTFNFIASPVGVVTNDKSGNSAFCIFNVDLLSIKNTFDQN